MTRARDLAAAHDIARVHPDAAALAADDAVDLVAVCTPALQHGPERARFFASNNLAVPRDVPFHLDRALWARTLGLRPVRRAASMAGLLAIWQLANAAGYALERGSALKRGRRDTD